MTTRKCSYCDKHTEHYSMKWWPGAGWEVTCHECGATAILQRAAALIEQGWTQMAVALDADGQAVSTVHDDACKWCASGALVRATVAYNGAQDEATGRAGFEATERFRWQTGERFIAPWNDRPGRTHAEVIAAFRAAIEGASA